MATNAKVVACAIIKDEPRFGETLANVRKAFGDALVTVLVHETSEDVMPAVEIADAFGENGSGRLIVDSRPFDDFSSARNACLDDAQRIASERGASWIFMFSAGAEISGKWEPRGHRGAPVLAHTEICGETNFLKPGPLHVRAKERYEGRTHESIAVPGGIENAPHCGLTVDYSKDYDPERKRKRCFLDIELLKDDYSPRGRFYLAQSFHVLGIHHEAFGYYARRLEMRGYEAERLQACCGAIATAPTIAAARWIAAYGRDCADVQLSLAERELEVHERYGAARAAVLASSLEKRSMFKNTRLAERCREILEKCK